MSLTPQSELREVYGITVEQLTAIEAFMQGAVYCWVKNQGSAEFAVRDLVGGENADWRPTPLQVLYEKHIGSGKAHDDAVEAAGRDLGWIVKSLLDKDPRSFAVSRPGTVNVYRWLGPNVLSSQTAVP